jgi:hypothetical protein
MNPRQSHQNFIDWMKAAGMFLIVFGHVVGDPFNIYNQITQPVYTKQLGVAFFVFITGWSLANDNRSGIRVVFNRIFPVYFYGVLFSLLLSFIFFFTKHDINESNYLPLIFGVNVLFNFFPANPTTWYIGTYIHLILFWYFFMRNKEIQKRHLVLAFVAENIIRYALIANGKGFIAYMLLPNWLSIFVLGSYLHSKQDLASTKSTVTLFILAWLCLLTFWVFMGNQVGFDKSFPFRYLSSAESAAFLLTSVLISFVYISNTLLVFQIARRLPAPRTVSFLARNTLIIFIVHMPVLYELSPYLYDLISTVWIKKSILIVLLYFGLAVFSEILQKLINIKFLNEQVWLLLSGAFKYRERK